MGIKLYMVVGSLDEEKELSVASKYFDVINSRLDIKQGDTVICRYTALPYYKELENDVERMGASLINAYRQHRYVADVTNWYYDLDGITFKTWNRVEEIPISETGPFVLKGETNSRKFLWKTHMFANDRASIGHVLCNLMNDSLIGQQKIVIRKFEKLHTYDVEQLSGPPVTNEWRFFICDGRVLSGGFYWSGHVEQIIEKYGKIERPPESIITDVICRVADNIRFYVVDVAQLEDGSWIVVELNDGQMSGLSEVNADELYSNLKRVLNA